MSYGTIPQHTPTTSSMLSVHFLSIGSPTIAYGKGPQHTPTTPRHESIKEFLVRSVHQFWLCGLLITTSYLLQLLVHSSQHVDSHHAIMPDNPIRLSTCTQQSGGSGTFAHVYVYSTYFNYQMINYSGTSCFGPSNNADADSSGYRCGSLQRGCQLWPPC
jgi:hypothetical protein